MAEDAEEPEETEPVANAADAEFIQRLRESDPADALKTPRVAPMTISELTDVPTRNQRHAMAVLTGTAGLTWRVLVRRGVWQRGEQVLFVRRDVLLLDEPRVREAVRTTFRRKTICLRGGVRHRYLELKTHHSLFRANPGALLSLAPFPDFQKVPFGTDVSALLKVTDEATLQQEEEARKLVREQHRAESAARAEAAMDRRISRAMEEHNRQRQQEMVAGGRDCQFTGNAPSYVTVTTLLHLEALPDLIERCRGFRFDVTEKEDGINVTLYCSRLQDPNRPLHICLMRREVKWTPNNYYWRLMRELGVAQRLLDSGRNLVLEGVVVGPFIRNGYEDGYRKDLFRVFRVFDLDEDRELTATERRDICRELGIPAVREIALDIPLFDQCPDLEAAQCFATRQTVRSMPCHGIVCKCLEPGLDIAFDIANPAYAEFQRSHEA